MLTRNATLIEKNGNAEKWERRDEEGRLKWREYRWLDPNKPSAAEENVVGAHLEEFHSNGKLFCVYDLDTEKGFLKQTEYAEDGVTRRECSEQRRAPGERYFAIHGPQIVWDEEGCLHQREIFVGGRRVTSEVFRKNGELESYEEFAEDGKTPMLVDRFTGEGWLMSRTYIHADTPVTTLAFEVTGQLKPGSVRHKTHDIPYEMRKRIEIETQMAEELGAEGLQQCRREISLEKLALS